jgi:hypothetical protein
LEAFFQTKMAALPYVNKAARETTPMRPDHQSIQYESPVAAQIQPVNQPPAYTLAF